MFAFLNVSKTIRKIQSRNKTLNAYYPKNVYDPLARREMKGIITRFNDLFYDAYPERLSGKTEGPVYLPPHTHSKKFEMDKELTLYKTKKIRKKDLVKIEQYLQMKYLTEEQMIYFQKVLNKAVETQKQLSDEAFSSFFPQLYESRQSFLQQIEGDCKKKIDELMKEHESYEKTIYELVHYPDNFLKDATRLLKGVVADSVKHVADTMNQSFRKK